MPWGVLLIVFFFTFSLPLPFFISFGIFGSSHYAIQAGYLKSQEEMDTEKRIQSK